jgi:hypothetical protein
MYSDPTLFCVSAWNDNGQKNHVKDPSKSLHSKSYNIGLLYRSNFFPGLGWMLTKKLWKELNSKWPNAYPLLTFYNLYLDILLIGMIGYESQHKEKIEIV